MKNRIKITTLLVIFVSLLIISCKEQKQKEAVKTKHNVTNEIKNEHNHDTNLAELDKNKDGYVYECPMQCEPASDKPGECSKCGMKLEKISVK